MAYWETAMSVYSLHMCVSVFVWAEAGGEHQEAAEGQRPGRAENERGQPGVTAGNLSLNHPVICPALSSSSPPCLVINYLTLYLRLLSVYTQIAPDGWVKLNWIGILLTSCLIPHSDIREPRGSSQLVPVQVWQPEEWWRAKQIHGGRGTTRKWRPHPGKQ